MGSGKGELLEVSLIKATLTDFCFCLAGTPAESFHAKARRDKKKSTKHKSTFG